MPGFGSLQTNVSNDAFSIGLGIFLAVVGSRVEKAKSFSFLPVAQFCQDAGYLSTAPLVPRANPLY